MSADPHHSAVPLTRMTFADVVDVGSGLFDQVGRHHGLR